VVSGSALVVALISLIVLFIVMRQGGMGRVAAEVRRRTRVWRQRTGLFAGRQAGARQRLATLVVASDMFKGKQFEINEPVVYLGREEERADLVFYWDEYASGRHAKIALEGEQFYLWDLNSANGTWVDEQRVPHSLSEGIELDEAVPLKEGTNIRIGPDLRLTFHLSSSPAVTAILPPLEQKETVGATTHPTSDGAAPLSSLATPPGADTLSSYPQPDERV